MCDEFHVDTIAELKLNKSMIDLLAIILVILLIGLGVLHGGLVLGRPWGEAAWGGRHDVLPYYYRIASLVMLPILFVAAILILARACLIEVQAIEPTEVTSTWLLVIFLGINTVAHLSSANKVERNWPAKISAALMLGAIVIALS